MQYVIKNTQSGEYLVAFSLDNDLGFFCFDPVSSILTELSQVCVFDSTTHAKLILNRLLQNNAYKEDSQDCQIVNIRDTCLANVSPEMKLAIKQLTKPPEVRIEEGFNLYVIRLDRENRRHNLRLLTDMVVATHLLTARPAPGDLIDFVLEGHVYKVFTVYQHGARSLTQGEAELDLHSYSKNGGRIKLKSAGNLIQHLWLEKLNGAEWDYAAIEVEVVTEPEKDNDFDEWLKGRKIKAVCWTHQSSYCEWRLA